MGLFFPVVSMLMAVINYFFSPDYYFFSRKWDTSMGKLYLMCGAGVESLTRC